MLGHLYDRALGGERCWVRHEDGQVRPLPTHRWLGACNGDALDDAFDDAVTRMCAGPTIELGCGPGRLVARLIRRGVPALGIDRSATAIRLAGRGGAPALLGGIFEPLPGGGGAGAGVVSWSSRPRPSASVRAGCAWSRPVRSGPGFGGHRSVRTAPGRSPR